MSGRPPDLPRTERDEAPMYLARYLERATRTPDLDEDPDDKTPLYLRRFRQRRSRETITAPLPPLWERSDHGMQMVLSEDNRNKEIGAPPQATRPVVNDVYLVRHAETQGYSTEAGITPLGTWQARSVGHTLARRVGAGRRSCSPMPPPTGPARPSSRFAGRSWTGWSCSRSTSRSSTPGRTTSSATSWWRPRTGSWM